MSGGVGRRGATGCGLMGAGARRLSPGCGAARRGSAHPALSGIPATGSGRGGLWRGAAYFLALSASAVAVVLMERWPSWGREASVLAGAEGMERGSGLSGIGPGAVPPGRRSQRCCLEPAVAV